MIIKDESGNAVTFRGGEVFIDGIPEYLVDDGEFVEAWLDEYESQQMAKSDALDATLRGRGPTP